MADEQIRLKELAERADYEAVTAAKMALDLVPSPNRTAWRAAAAEWATIATYLNAALARIEP